MCALKWAEIPSYCKTDSMRHSQFLSICQEHGTAGEADGKWKEK